MEQWYIWLIIVIILTILEATTVNLVTIWFVVSGIAALALSFFTDNFLIQFAVFVLLGIVLLVTTRGILVNLIKTKKIPTNFDMVLGSSGVVTETIKKHKPGEVKVKGKLWTAVSDKTIEKGMNVRVLEINGVKVKVEEEK